jgi:hypothetical protein
MPRIFHDNNSEKSIFSASFHAGCIRLSPEACFLAQFRIPLNILEPFGHDEKPKEILVWHTKTREVTANGPSRGYVTT